MIVATLRGLQEEFLKWAAKMRSPKTVTGYRHYLDRFLAAVGDLCVTELKPLHLITWAKTWHQVQAVQRLFRWAKDEAELIERNPFARVPMPHAGQRRRVLDRKTLARMMRRAGVELRYVLFALRETIARPQEVRALRWEHVTYGGRALSLEEALAAGEGLFMLEEYKSRDRRHDSETPRIIPISPRLGRLLVRLLERRGKAEGIIFRNTHAEPWTQNALRCAFRSLRRKMKLKPDHRGENVVSYSIRHTVATWATAAGVRDRLLADILGHTSTRTTRRYQHLQTEHLQHALRSILARKKGKGGTPPATPL